MRPCEAEDIVQNVFIRVWKKRETLNPELSIKSFLFRAVHDEFVDHYRKNRAITIVDEKYYETIQDLVEEREDRELEQMIRVMRMEIENLPPKCKKVFLMSKREGLTNLEIAEYLGISVKMVEAHITRAFSILRKRIGAQVEVILYFLFQKATSPSPLMPLAPEEM